MFSGIRLFEFWNTSAAKSVEYYIWEAAKKVFFSGPATEAFIPPPPA